MISKNVGSLYFHQTFVLFLLSVKFDLEKGKFSIFHENLKLVFWGIDYLDYEKESLKILKRLITPNLLESLSCGQGKQLL